MRSTIRSFTFGLALSSAGAVMSQYPYTVILQGTIGDCYPGQTVNVQTTQGTQPSYNFAVPVDPGSCTWTASLPVSSNPAFFTATTICNGSLVSASGQADFNFFMDSVVVASALTCGGGPLDCNEVENGPDMPGTPCDDGDPQTVDDTWTPYCTCLGVSPGDCWTLADWQQVMDGGSPVPFEIALVAASSGAQPITYSWYFGWPWVLEGTSTTPTWQRTFAPGESMACQVVAVDANGCESQWSNVEGLMNCDGIMGSPNWPGLPCTVQGTTQPGIWSADCVCEPDTTQQIDCEGNPGGSALPGTACLFSPDSGNTWISGIWSIGCICEADTTQEVDCEGTPGGSALPGTPCTVPGTILEGTWDSACACIPNNTDPCEANFWVIQAMGPDSLPVPYELWVWNLSTGGSGNFVFTWDFGDGTSSTEAFPTHTYSGNGPYDLCLTIMDNNGCTDTFCDSVSINADGIFEGMMVHAEDRQEGFTINVRDPWANALPEALLNGDIALWPNPARDDLNVAVVSDMRGAVTVTVTDLGGRTVRAERAVLTGGRNLLRIAMDGLEQGMYVLRITDGMTNLSQRFVKTN